MRHSKIRITHMPKIFLIALAVLAVITASLSASDMNTEIESKKRLNFCNTALVSIDNPETYIIDDAVYAEPDPQRAGGFRLLVAIADPSSAAPKTKASLDPNTPRPAVVGEYYIDANGAVLSYKFYLGTINSKCKLTYDEVNNHIHKPTDGLRANLPADLILNLFRVYWALDKSTGNKYNSNKLIQSMMALFNKTATEFIRKHEYPRRSLSFGQQDIMSFTSPIKGTEHRRNLARLATTIMVHSQSSVHAANGVMGTTRNSVACDHREGQLISFNDEAPPRPSKTSLEVKQLIPSNEVRWLSKVIPFITISHEMTAGADHAIFVEKDLRSGKSGWHVMVAVSDVNSIMWTNTISDQNAKDRGVTAFAPDFMPMLNEANGSKYLLMPKRRHPVLVADLYIDLFGQLIEWQFYQAIMSSNYHLSFSMLDDLRSNPNKNITDSLGLDINDLYGAYHALKHNRQMRGVGKLKRDTYGLGFQPPYESYNVVEEILTLANLAAANFIVSYGLPTIYRVCDELVPQRLSELKDWLKHNKHLIEHQLKPEDRHIIDGHSKLDQKDMQSILTLFVSFPYDYRTKVEDMVFGAMADEYSHKNSGHNGLKLEHYVHFTYPTYSYANIIVHRAILSIIKRYPALYPYSEEDLKAMADDVAKKEYEANEAWMRRRLRSPNSNPSHMH